MDAKIVVKNNERFLFNLKACERVPHDVWRQKIDQIVSMEVIQTNKKSQWLVFESYG